MAGIYTAIDKQAAKLAEDAEQLGKKARINRAKAFDSLVGKDLRFEGIPALTIEWMRAPSAQKREEVARNERLRRARFSLEAELLRFDDAVDGNPLKKPSKEELRRFNEVVASVTGAISTRLPRTVWEQCKRIDRSFPRAKVCRRITKFIDRILDTEPRPLGKVMCSKTYVGAEHAKTFIGLVEDVRRGKKKAEKIDWLPFERLLLTAKGAKDTNRLYATKHTTGAPDSGLAYIALLEVDRADQKWVHRHYSRMWEVALWTIDLGNDEMAARFQPFLPGSKNFAECCAEAAKEANQAAKRLGARNRQAKRRKKTPKSVTHPGGPNLKTARGGLRKPAISVTRIA